MDHALLLVQACCILMVMVSHWPATHRRHNARHADSLVARMRSNRSTCYSFSMVTGRLVVNLSWGFGLPLWAFLDAWVLIRCHLAWDVGFVDWSLGLGLWRPLGDGFVALVMNLNWFLWDMAAEFLDIVVLWVVGENWRIRAVVIQITRVWSHALNRFFNGFTFRRLKLVRIRLRARVVRILRLPF